MERLRDSTLDTSIEQDGTHPFSGLLKSRDCVAWCHPECSVRLEFVYVTSVGRVGLGGAFTVDPAIHQ